MSGVLQMSGGTQDDNDEGREVYEFTHWANISLNIFETLGIDYMSYRVQKNTRHLSVHT